jgi:hypothetical protein
MHILDEESNQRCEIRQNTWTGVSNTHIVCSMQGYSAEYVDIVTYFGVFCLISDVFRTSDEDEDVGGTCDRL